MPSRRAYRRRVSRIFRDWSGEVEVATAAADRVALSVADGLRGLEPPSDALRPAHERLLGAAPTVTPREASVIARVEEGLEQRPRWRAALAEIEGAALAGGSAGGAEPYARRVRELADRWTAAREAHARAIDVAGTAATRRLTRLRPAREDADRHTALVAATRDFHSATNVLFQALLDNDEHGADPRAAAAAATEQQARLGARLEELLGA